MQNIIFRGNHSKQSRNANMRHEWSLYTDINSASARVVLEWVSSDLAAWSPLRLCSVLSCLDITMGKSAQYSKAFKKSWLKDSNFEKWIQTVNITDNGAWYVLGYLVQKSATFEGFHATFHKKNLATLQGASQSGDLPLATRPYISLMCQQFAI